jgi:hypothetical protein
MKNILIFFATSFLNFGIAQVTVFNCGEVPLNPPSGSYIKDNINQFNKFSGTWVFNQNGQYFKITLLKVIDQPYRDVFTDDIYGNFLYQINGYKIADTENLTGEQSPMYLSRLYSDLNKVHMAFNDPERPRMGAHVELIYSIDNNGVERLNWNLFNTGLSPTTSGTVNLPNQATNFRVPQNLVLVKQ